ncbi:CLUMA_CG019556, isoform A [Clunio marinus]|uniref:CLUMA_CG019556, isoform A n=1 Tax=Clunio marinus TaxID=568069 RepID=A0A1J1J738_9DIPT|nr:CLUMA_CG019556, isoform A [Clunio marinus]
MAGVLFIICVPVERYEQIISNKSEGFDFPWIKSVAHSIKVREPLQPVQQLNSPDIAVTSYENLKESQQSSSLSTSVGSFDSDSVNPSHREDRRKISTITSKNDKKKPLQRTKSADDVISESKEKISDDEFREKLGSVDSDVFNRTVKKHARIVENEKATDKFYGTNTERPQLDDNTPLERVIQEIIERMEIRNVSWVRVNSGNCYQVQFTLENGDRCDDTIHLLSEFGIGQKEGSSVAIIPCTLYNSEPIRKPNIDDEAQSGHSGNKEKSWNKFIGTVRARLNVAKIVEAVKSDGDLTFDFIVLLIVASILASFGLVENSTLFLAASMLISPLMGPILAATFGAVIKDHKLQFWGVRNEIIGILLCIFVGSAFGLITCGLDSIFASEKHLQLTLEMSNRTNFHSVIVGIFIALPSGAAVAIAVLGENFGSLVGVAISASLLPPAVNTGLMWSFSLVHACSKDFSSRFKSFVMNKKYSDDQAIELLALGGISLLVTLTNVLCVYLMGYFFLKVKEVAPVSDDHQRQFWKHDIKIARDYNKTLHAEEGRNMQAQLSQYVKNESINFKGVGAELLRQNHYPYNNTWSPLTLRYNNRKEGNHARTSLHDLDALYMNLAGRNGITERHSCSFGRVKSPSPQQDNLSTDNKYKHGIAIPTRIQNSYDGLKAASAPLEVICETPKRIHHDSNLVGFNHMASTSGTSAKKFIVTPAHDPLK